MGIDYTGRGTDVFDSSEWGYWVTELAQFLVSELSRVR
jgi:hypothetical protein